MRRWRHRVLFSFAVFYLFVYMGRFNHWPAGPVIREDLGFTHVDIGIINACLLWGFAIGDFVHGRLAESYGYRFWILIGTLGSVASDLPSGRSPSRGVSTDSPTPWSGHRELECSPSGGNAGSVDE